MDRRVHTKLAMARSVRTFSRAHPSDDAGYVLVLDWLHGTIERIEELGMQEVGGFASKRSASIRRRDVRRRMQLGLLRHVVIAAKHAGLKTSEVTGMFRLPSSSARHAVFRAEAAELLDLARAHQAVLVAHGMSAMLLNELEAALAEFDASAEEHNGGKQGHVGARAEMKALSAEIMRLVGMLDGFNRHRFHREPELIVAWESARRLTSEPHGNQEVPGASGPGLEPAA